MRHSRRIIQLIFTAGLIYLLLSQRQVNLLHPLYTWISYLDPLAGLAALIHSQWSLWLLLSAAALAAAVLWGRFFCGWICPVGAVLDLFAAGKRLIHWRNWQPKAVLLKYLRILRWVLLGATVGLILPGHALALFMNPLVLWSREVERITSLTLPWSLLIIVLLGLASFPRLWCRFLCPTGSLLNLIGRLRGELRKPGAGCSGCQLCIKRCPMNNITAEVNFSSDCLRCDECRRVCPSRCLDEASTLNLDAPVIVDRNRRDFLISAAAGLGALALGGVARILPKAIPGIKSNGPVILRPPGALMEEAFLTACNRCGQCVSVCPTKVLVSTGLEAGLTGIGTPRFAPVSNHCTLCGACDRICPTGALAPVPEQEMRMGTAIIIKKKCYGWLDGGGLCYLDICLRRLSISIPSIALISMKKTATVAGHV
ncbi:MAG TPA: 4Fe-4S binding protein [Bacillota bacterium]|nr:4Fe-4S binding protein [Bacillota bacterium]